jgi:hypothetical protein
MTTLEKADWEILNVTADDCENLEQIYRGVCYEMVLVDPEDEGHRAHAYRERKGAPLLSEVAGRVRKLVEKGLLVAVMDEEGRPFQALDDLSYVWRGWFRMTPEGRSVWDSSEYATLAEQEQPQ